MPISDFRFLDFSRVTPDTGCSVSCFLIPLSSQSSFINSSSGASSIHGLLDHVPNQFDGRGNLAGLASRRGGCLDGHQACGACSSVAVGSLVGQ